MNLTPISQEEAFRRGLPRSWIEEFAKKVRPIVDELVVEFNL